MKRLITTLILCVWPLFAAAQFFPDYETTTVNDFAGVLSADAESKLTSELESLRSDTGVEMTLVTLTRQETYAPDMTMEAFATALFNEWGVGDKDRNDGIMVLVLVEDREMRIELGSGYGSGWNWQAQQVINRSFLPSFRDGNYPAGIQTGVGDTIASIARPFAEDAPAPKPEGSSGISWLWALLIAVPIAGPLLWGKFQRMKERRRPCPSCNQKGGLSTTHETLVAATKENAGRNNKILACSLCGYRDAAEYETSRLSSSSGRSSSFGGGSSSGGGASGKW